MFDWVEAGKHRSWQSWNTGMSDCAEMVFVCTNTSFYILTFWANHQVQTVATISDCTSLQQEILVIQDDGFRSRGNHFNSNHLKSQIVHQFVCPYCSHYNSDLLHINVGSSNAIPISLVPNLSTFSWRLPKLTGKLVTIKLTSKHAWWTSPFSTHIHRYQEQKLSRHHTV